MKAVRFCVNFSSLLTVKTLTGMTTDDFLGLFCFLFQRRARGGMRKDTFKKLTPSPPARPPQQCVDD
jgi:hypothetical protein